jgi:FtsP/CotA-like multicopper oxidase with cupredoxin domain
MRNTASKRIPQIVALLMAGSLAAAATAAAYLPAGSSGGAPAAAAAPNDPMIDLCATTGTLSLPGAPSVPIWGFVIKPPATDCTSLAGSATLPGPVLSVDESATDLVTLNVTNGLPPGHTISVVVPGLSFDPGSTDAAVGDTVSRTFHPTAPGTYLYQSVGDAERQTAMGLYGALIVRPTAPGQAYDSASSAYDVEAPLVLSDIDPAFNADPDGFDMNNYLASYWLINGRAYPDTAPIHAGPGQRVLLRYANAGHDNTTMAMLGMHERVLARDANLIGNPVDADAETIPAGATEDAIATVPAGSSALPNGFPLYNRQLHVGNGAPADPASPGGMLTFIKSP